MFTIIKIKCSDQILSFEEKPKIASGGLKEDKLQITFDDKWNGYIKTAIFYKKKEEVYEEQIDINNECFIPAVILTEPGTIYISIYGKKEDSIRTSNVIKYKIIQGSSSDNIDPLESYKNELVTSAQRPLTAFVNKLREYFIGGVYNE